jgi:hypothetical protein
MHARLLHRASLKPQVQQFDSFRESYIIPQAPAEYGNFVHFEDFGSPVGFASPQTMPRLRKPPKHVPANWKNNMAKQIWRSEYEEVLVAEPSFHRISIFVPDFRNKRHVAGRCCRLLLYQIKVPQHLRDAESLSGNISRFCKAF